MRSAQRAAIFGTASAIASTCFAVRRWPGGGSDGLGGLVSAFGSIAVVGAVAAAGAWSQLRRGQPDGGRRGRRRDG